jgi:hypothetical protein
MLVQEADAKRYFCPVVSAAQQHIVCKGSHCMAWRWASYNPDEMVSRDPAEIHAKLGYCGLAGVITLPPVC